MLYRLLYIRLVSLVCCSFILTFLAKFRQSGFGLKAVILSFAWPEEKELEDLEQQLKQVEDVNSVQVVDIRRAVG